MQNIQYTRFLAFVKKKKKLLNGKVSENRRRVKNFFGNKINEGETLICDQKVITKFMSHLSNFKVLFSELKQFHSKWIKVQV